MRKFFYLIIVVGVLVGAYKLQHAKLAKPVANATATQPTTTTPLGNVLSAYFYYLGAKHDQAIVARHAKFIAAYIDPELKQFYQSLNWHYSIKAVSFASDSRAAWNQINYDGTYKPNFLHFWQNLRPLMQDIYAKTLPNNTTPYPVVHFRCSDSPFNKHFQYHIPTRASVEWMAQLIKNRGYDKVILLNCNAHRSLDQNSCAKYTDYYRRIFTSAGLGVQMQCSSIFNDFAAMVRSPLLVSLNQSSFSFLAGVAKDPHDYIACNMGIEIDGKYILQTEADWILDPRPPLLHTQVLDYNQADTVIAQLDRL